MGTQTIVIADDQYLIIEGLKTLIEPIYCFEIIATISTKVELYEQIRQSPQPSILIIDPDRVEDFTVDCFKDITTFYPVSNIMVLTSNTDKEHILSVLAYGITHFLLKTCAKEEMLSSLIGITKNEDYLCKYAIEMLLNKNTSLTLKREKEVKLTKKEMEITKLVTQGLTTKDIASKSYLSVHTVNTHRRNILKKLGLNNTSELVLYAVRNGITDALEYYI